MQAELQAVRAEIDAIDKQIQQLIEARAKLAVEVARIKSKTQKDPIFYQPDREAQILRQRLQDYHGLLQPIELTNIFRLIISACLNLQQRQTVAFLGPLGTYSHLSVRAHFGESVNLLAVNSLEEVVQAVSKQQASLGVIPIENTTTGIVTEGLSAIVAKAVSVCGEINIPIQHHLLRSPQHTTSIRAIYSHQQSFWQCQTWLLKNFPDVPQIVVSSNAKAAEIAQADPSAAAIAGELAREQYQLRMVAKDIQDNPHNATRFLIIGKHAVAASGADHTAILISSTRAAVNLVMIMDYFNHANIPLRLCQSCHLNGSTREHVFYVEILGHRDDENIQQVLSSLQKESMMYTILGSYPQSQH
jgi:chorismate mutase/prephenate dehydratase